MPQVLEFDDFVKGIDPQPASGGFPYNLRSVAECDPRPKPRRKVVHPCHNSHCPCQYGMEVAYHVPS